MSEVAVSEEADHKWSYPAMGTHGDLCKGILCEVDQPGRSLPVFACRSFMGSNVPHGRVRLHHPAFVEPGWVATKGEADPPDRSPEWFHDHSPPQPTHSCKGGQPNIMTAPMRYRIELRGNVSDRLLEPYLDEFVISRTEATTSLSGPIRDPSHLHGIVSHLTSRGIELVSFREVAGSTTT